MGYTTDFDGEFMLDRPLTPEHKAYLKAFADTRRMKRDPEITATRPDPVREAVGLPVGKDGGYFVGAGGFRGQEELPHTAITFARVGITDYNRPPDGQPCLWCQWIPNPYQDGDSIVWDENEKFYDYIEWLKYLIKHFLGPWGYTLSGTVEWRGEDPADRGKIVVTDNSVAVFRARIEYVLDEEG